MIYNNIIYNNNRFKNTWKYNYTFTALLSLVNHPRCLREKRQTAEDIEYFFVYRLMFNKNFNNPELNDKN